MIALYTKYSSNLSAWINLLIICHTFFQYETRNLYNYLWQ